MDDNRKFRLFSDAAARLYSPERYLYDFAVESPVLYGHMHAYDMAAATCALRDIMKEVRHDMDTVSL